MLGSPSANRITSPSYPQRRPYNPMQSPSYQQSSINPTIRLNDSRYTPSGFNVIDNTPVSSTPVATHRPSEPTGYNSSPTYSPIIHTEENRAKKEEEDDD